MNMNTLAIAAALAMTATGVQAADTTGTFTVSTNVTASCAVSATDLVFTDVDPLANATDATDGITTISVTCSNTTPYDVGLSAGVAAGATTATRRMTHTDGTNTLGYALFSDAIRSSNWGDTVSTDTVAGIGSGVAEDLTVYGQIASGQQTATVGAYTDTITVTVTY
jgi:spore coat protein U-like protein